MEASNYTLTHFVTSSRYLLIPHFDVIKRAFTVINLSISSLGIATNVCNIVVFSKIGIFENATSVSFFALSLTDLTYLLLYLGSLLVNVLNYLNVRLRVPYVYLSFSFLSYSHMAYNCSIVITVYLTVQKCFCVALPFSFQHEFTRGRAVAAILLLVVFIASWFVPGYATFGLEEKWDPRSNTTRVVLWFGENRRQIMEAFDAFIQNVLPTAAQIIIIVCLTIIVIKMRESSRFRGSTSRAGNDDPTSKGQSGVQKPSVHLSGRSLQAVKSTTLVAAMFVVCNLPSVCVTYATFLEPEFNDFRRLGYLYALSGSARLCLFAACSSLNMLVYLKFNRSYRQELYKCLGRQPTQTEIHTDARKSTEK